MGILGLIVFGALVGWLTGFFVAKGGGLLFTILLGIVGSVVGGLIFQLLGGSGVTGFNLYSIVVGVVGSIILILLVNKLTR